MQVEGIAVRAVTHFIVLSKDAATWKPTLTAAASFCAECAKRFETAGYAVQTLRLVTNPFGEYLDVSTATAAVAGIRQIEAILQSPEMPKGTRIRFAIGEARTLAELEVVPDLIKAAA